MTMKLGKETGSVMNWLRSTSTEKPVVGQGATHLQWTDRDAYTVIEVSADGKKVVIQKDIAKRTDSLGISESQTYEYLPDENGKKIELVFQRGSWRQVVSTVVFTDEFRQQIEILDYQERQELVKDCFNEYANLKLVKGKTKIQKTYKKFNVQFGERDEYFDFCF